MKRRTLARCIAVADEWFSKYIRKNYSDKHTGYVSCVTCGKTAQWEKDGIEAGHYLKRGNFSLRYDEKNVHPQCTRCNHYLSGNQSSYALFLTRNYGENILELLEIIKNEKPMTALQKRELCEMTIETYKKKFEEL